MESVIFFGGILISRKEFPNASPFICDLHRNQAWNPWVRSSKNGLSSKEEQEFLTALLQRVANARTIPMYNTARLELQRSKVYTTKPNVQRYVEKTWVSCAERWMQATKKQALNIANANNRFEAQKSILSMIIYQDQDQDQLISQHLVLH